MNAKDKWIQEIETSFDKAKRVEMPASLSRKILQELNDSKAVVISIRPQIKWAVAACLILLIGLNSLMVIQYNKSIKQTKEQASVSFYKNYFDYTEQF